MYLARSVGYTTLSRNDIRSALDYYGVRYDTPTYSQIVADATAPTIAYCTSERCCRVRHLGGKTTKHRWHIRKEVHKDVDKSRNDCPDCGHALLWKKANWVRRM